MKRLRAFAVPGVMVLLALVLFIAHQANAQSTVTKIGGYSLMVPLPGVGEPAPATLAEYVRFIYLWLMRVVALAAGIMLVFGGVKYTLSSGDPGKAQDARETISRALLGLVVVLASYLILNTINPGLVNFGGAEIPKVNLPIARTFAPIGGAPQEGQCFSTAAGLSGLGGTDCSVIGNGWLPNPAGCSGSCSAAQVCCVCNAGFDCAPMEHTCAKIDSSGASAQEFSKDPLVCGPYLRADCNNACPPAFPSCVAGSCSDPVGETQKFEIQSPLPPQKGIPATPVGMSQTISIVVRAPSEVAVVEVKAYCPSGSTCAAGSVVFTDACSPPAGVCSVLWNDGVTGPGNWRIEAIGKDAAGNVITGMRDERIVCGDCGPQASFSITQTCADGTANCVRPGIFCAEPSSGMARLRLDGSGSTSASNVQLINFDWSEETSGLLQPVYFGEQPAPIVTVPIAPGTHTIELRAYDEYGSYGSAKQAITVVTSC